MRNPGHSVSTRRRVEATARTFPPLSRDVEHALAVRARHGDAAARQTLVRHHLALVSSVARRYDRGTAPLEDLLQEGSVGLVRAAERFDPDAGVRFMTYAVWWIRAYVGKYAREASSSVRPRAGDVARRDVSLDAPAEDRDAGPDLEALEDDAPGPEERSAAAERGAHVREALRRLQPRLGPVAWDIVARRLQQSSPATLREIGEHWGLSRERVRQVEARTKATLQRELARTLDVRIAAPPRPSRTPSLVPESAA
jgi:RNA polymerase sigma factor (sigma-70 family)